MTYHTPELLLIGAAQGLVLGASGIRQKDDNVCAVPNDSSRSADPGHNC
jgi:hypothetical protein